MKYILTVLFSALSLSLLAQDSIATIGDPFHEVRKQKFIDRYENVFMTKEPTRHMFKIGGMPFGIARGVTSVYDNAPTASHILGYEFKIAPPFSIGVNAYGIVGISNSSVSGTSISARVNVSGQLRWYYDMKGRIRKGLSANNFSGNYLGLTYDHHYTTNEIYSRKLPRAGIEYGVQRRFMNLGFIDLAVGAYRNEEGSVRFRNKEVMKGYISEQSGWTIATRAAIGFAFGDWKKKKTLPDCEVLRCDEEVKSQFMISWPHMTLGTFQQILQGSVGYERKLFPSVSAKAELSGFLNSYAMDTGPRETYKGFSSSIQIRYYTFQRKARKKGKGGYDLNGFYLGPLLEYYSLLRNSRYLGEVNSQQRDLFNLGLGVGYQHILFKHAYIDVGWNLSTNLVSRGGGRGVLDNSIDPFRLGFGLRF